jgi:hypothetical protein
MSTEPIRLPAVVVALLLIFGPPLAAVLAGADPGQAVATAIVGLIASGGVIGVTESKRARTDSPATITRRLADLSRSNTFDLSRVTVDGGTLEPGWNLVRNTAETEPLLLPEDERDHGHEAP